MTHEEIKRHRTESVLKEIIPEALGSLSDDRINGLCVTDVVCSKGRSDAKVYLDKSFLTPKEQGEALRQLRTVSGYIQNHCSRVKDGLVHLVLSLNLMNNLNIKTKWKIYLNK